MKRQQPQSRPSRHKSATGTEKAPMHILLVEDNPDDVFLMQRALDKTQLQFCLTVVTDGIQAVDYLSGTGTYECRQSHPLPDIVFLDLKLPFLDGFDVLTQLREARTLDTLNVVILSSSLEDGDRENAQLFNVPYTIKPPTTEMVTGMMFLLGLIL